MKVYQFNFSDYMSYCGGCMLVAATSLEEAKKLAHETRRDLDDGCLFIGLEWNGNSGVILNEFYAE